MSDVVAVSPVSGLQVVNLRTVKPAELEGLWRREGRLWRERLLWDRSSTLATLQRVLEHGALPGKAVRVGARTVAYAYYMITGRLGLISGLVISPDWSSTAVGGRLLKETIDEIRRQEVARIESQFVGIDCPWLTPVFEGEGFRAYGREFMRLELRRRRALGCPLAMMHLEPWQGPHLREAAAIMQAAYEGGVDAEINELYRTSDGCAVVLNTILNQSGCGVLVADASAMVRHRGRGIGFVVVTEIAPRQAHLAQVVVVPEYQHRGVGQWLLDYSLSRLVELQFDTFSLIVSRSNYRAVRRYQSMGFESVLSFPVFTWQR